MSAARLKPSQSALTWFGVFGAPGAWILQHVVGISMTLATCGLTLPGGGNVRTGPDAATFHTVNIAAMATAAVVAVLAGVAAFVAFRSTSGEAPDAGPPGGRIHFLATVGLAITPLFFFIILMSGLGSTFLPECRQA